MTTNYDSSLERAYQALRPRSKPRVIEWNDVESRDHFISSLGNTAPRVPSFVHWHGIASKPKNIVLTDEDYLKRYVHQKEARRLLFAVFATKTVVFVGFGMQDPELMQLLRAVASSLSCRKSTHFAIMPFKRGKQDAEWIRDRLKSKFQIVPLFYPAVTSHAHLTTLIHALRWQNASMLPTFSESYVQKSASVESRTAKVTTHAATPMSPVWRAPPIVDRDDPQRGRWGGLSERNGRCLTAKVRTISKNWFRVNLTVEAMRGAPDIASPVWFHLHDSFPQAHLRPDAQTARGAQLELHAYGAFTVGAEIRGEAINGHPTVLELDLSRLASAPEAFRES